jgi:hypothetical protein
MYIHTEIGIFKQLVILNSKLPSKNAKSETIFRTLVCGESMQLLL